MQYAQTRKLAPMIGVHFPHGIEIVPTAVDDTHIRYASVDSDGTIRVWTSPTPPYLENGTWTAEQIDVDLCLPASALYFVETDNPADDGYPLHAESLRKIAPADLCA